MHLEILLVKIHRDAAMCKPFSKVEEKVSNVELEDSVLLYPKDVVIAYAH